MAAGCGTGKVGFKLDVPVTVNTTYCEPCSSAADGWDGGGSLGCGMLFWCALRCA